VITILELDKSGEVVRQMGRSRVTCFPHEQDPLRVLFKFAGTVPDYLKDLLKDTTGRLSAGVEKLIHGHLKTGDEYSTDLDEDELPFYDEASNMITTPGPIPTEYKTMDSVKTVQIDLQAIQPGVPLPKASHEEKEQPSIGERVQNRTNRTKHEVYAYTPEVPDTPQKTKAPRSAHGNRRKTPCIDTALDDLQDYTLSKTDKAAKVTTKYRQQRLDALEGINAKEAIGTIVPGKKGDIKYTVSDFKYDIGTGVLKLVSTKRSDPNDPDAIDAAALAASTFLTAKQRLEVNVGPSTQMEVDGVDKASNSIMAQACQLQAADNIFLDFHMKQANDSELAAHEVDICAGQVLEAWDIAVGGASYASAAKFTASPKKDLHKHNPGWSKSWLLEKSNEFNKSYKLMEQLLANQPWEMGVWPRLHLCGS
jgi:hypothetical protein